MPLKDPGGAGGRGAMGRSKGFGRFLRSVHIIEVSQECTMACICSTSDGRIFVYRIGLSVALVPFCFLFRMRFPGNL